MFEVESAPSTKDVSVSLASEALGQLSRNIEFLAKGHNKGAARWTHQWYSRPSLVYPNSLGPDCEADQLCTHRVRLRGKEVETVGVRRRA